MQDQYGRKINYLRISITDRCNLSCIYCRLETAMKYRHADILTYEEILTVCEACTKLGITNFKITGGEPSVRKGWLDFVRRLQLLPGVGYVSLTTNGLDLAEYLPDLADMKISGINISLDTVNEAEYERITGSDRLRQVQENIAEAVRLGLNVKLNCVPLADAGAEEISALIKYADALQVPLRFIELMPLACNQQLQGISGEKLREILNDRGIFLTKSTRVYGNGPAVYYETDNLSIPIGFIEPLHGKFCHTCNRVRLTSTGFLKTCLYSSTGADLKAVLRSGEGQLTEIIRQTVYDKPQSHQFENRLAVFQMNEIGG